MDMHVTFVFEEMEETLQLPLGSLPRKGETVEIPGFPGDGEQRSLVVENVNHFIGDKAHKVTIDLVEA